MTDEYTKDQDMIRSEETSKDDENKILREDVASLVDECYKTWRKAEELLSRLEMIAVTNCLDRYRDQHPDLSWFYDDEFMPLWTLEDKGYVRFRWAGRELYLEARIYRDGRVECIAERRR
jgi:hypothetical protein